MDSSEHGKIIGMNALITATMIRWVNRKIKNILVSAFNWILFKRVLVNKCKV